MKENNQIKSWWEMSKEEVCSSLATDDRLGLSQAMAERRLQEIGPNQLPEASPLSIFPLIQRQFSNVIIWILIGAALIAGFLQEWIDALVIVVILFFNAILGFFQEYRAEKSLESLRKLALPTSKVIREGKLKTIPSDQVVPGDLILLEAGDHIPSDGRVIEAIQLAAQEAALTGEATSVYKISDPLKGENLALGDQINRLFMGTVAVNGKGYMIATETGPNTELGKIASSLQKGEEELTPLQKRLEQFGTRLVWLCLAIIVVVFGIGFLRGYPLMELILTALSLAVAAIPEGLPAIVTIVLAIGIRRMAKRNALIRRLPSVETLGCTTVICSDKTGTLTQNEMAVQALWLDKTFYQVTGLGYQPEGKVKKDEKEINPSELPDLELLLQSASLCNNANLYQDNQEWKISGDPTEAALLVAAQKCGINKEELDKTYQRKQEIPFDSERKRMSVLAQDSGRKKYFLFCKGAVDVILSLSNSILLDGKKSSLTNDLQQDVLNANHQLASQGLRVLAFAYREVEQEKLDPQIENELIIIGLIAMMDPPRPEVKKAIEACSEAGIKTIMITGDHKETAFSIAKDLGLMKPDSLIVEGKEIEQMDSKTLEDSIEKIAVCARVSANHKVKIIEALRKKDEIVAMTGDGVNDAPSLKKADIGIAMGITGTEVTKEASDMIITDDNFASIVKAIEEGRGIYDNIVKFISYLFSTNLAEILIIFLGMLINFKDQYGQPFIPLLPTQILWINLLSDGFPALALGMDPIDKNVLKKPPRNPKEPLLPFHLTIRLVMISLIITVSTLTISYISLKSGREFAQTMTFTTLVVLELVKVQIIRSPFKLGFFSNPWLIFAITISFLLQVLVVYFPPLQILFHTTPLGLNNWLTIGLTSLIVLCLGLLVNNLSFKFISLKARAD